MTPKESTRGNVFHDRTNFLMENHEKIKEMSITSVVL